MRFGMILLAMGLALVAGAPIHAADAAGAVLAEAQAALAQGQYQAAETLVDSALANRNLPDLVRALELAVERGTSVFGVVGRQGGYTATVASACVVIPPLYADRVTPHTEGLAAVVWHLLVSHPALAANTTKWEGIT